MTTREEAIQKIKDDIARNTQEIESRAASDAAARLAERRAQQEVTARIKGWTSQEYGRTRDASGTPVQNIIDSIYTRWENLTPEEARAIDQRFADSQPMSGDTFVGYRGTQRLTLSDVLAQGSALNLGEISWVNQGRLPTRDEWRKDRVIVIGRVREQTNQYGRTRTDVNTYDFGVLGEQYVPSDETSGSRGGGGGGRGGGGGALGPVYVNPDRAQVEDYVKSYVVATTGKAHQDLIESGVAAFLATDRQGFDSEDQAYDPATAMKNTIRSSDKYKAVHQRRPDSVDEMDWVGSRQGQLRQLGLSASLAEEVGIETSIAGAAGEAVRGAGEVAQVGATGRLLEEQRERLKSKAVAAARLM